MQSVTINEKVNFHAPDLVFSLAFSPDNSILASGSGNGSIALWSLQGTSAPTIIPGHATWVNALAFSPDGRLLVSGGTDRVIKVWDVSTHRQVGALMGHTGAVTALAFSVDGALVASASADKTVRLWGIATGEEVMSFVGHRGDVKAISFSPDGTYLVSGSVDETVRMWNLASGSETMVLHSAGCCVEAVAINPDGTLVASGGRSISPSVILWDVASGRVRQTIALSVPEPVLALAFSPDGAFLSGGVGEEYDHSGALILWDGITGHELQVLLSDFDVVNAVVFGHDSGVLASTSKDGDIHLWQIR